MNRVMLPEEKIQNAFNNRLQLLKSNHKYSIRNYTEALISYSTLTI